MREQSLYIIIYPGEDTANEVYQTLRGLEKQDKIEIKTAATIYRKEDGKLRLKHRQRLTLWKDEFDVGSIFEGRDSAGKGGIIKRITYRLSPRVARVQKNSQDRIHNPSHTQKDRPCPRRSTQ